MKTANTAKTAKTAANEAAATVPATNAPATKAAPAPKEQAKQATKAKAASPKGKGKVIPVPAPADTSWSFSSTEIGILGRRFPVTYSVAQKSGDVYAFAVVDGEGVRVHIDGRSPSYHRAFDAAMAAKTVPAPKEQAAKVKAAPAPKEQPKAKATKAAPAPKEQANRATKAAPAPKEQAKAKAAKAAPAPKEQPMSGNGWRIVEDNADGRVRVYLDANVSDAVKAAVEDGGFWWSPTKQAYSKRNNPRGMKAAAALAETLAAITK